VIDAESFISIGLFVQNDMLVCLFCRIYVVNLLECHNVPSVSNHYTKVLKSIRITTNTQ
jgi:hypothetical protein